MGTACNEGCFECGPVGQRMHHVDTGCCHSTLCNSQMWTYQCEKWLQVEREYVETWLAAEVAFKEKLATVHAVKRHTYVPRESLPTVNPAAQRGVKVPHAH